MSTVTGTVKWVGSKTVRNSQLWSFTIQESEEFYRTGFDKPNINRGDVITFDVEVNQYGNQVKAKSIKIAEAAASAAPPAAGGGSRAVEGGKDAYWKDKEAKDVIKDAAIQFLSCTNTAVSIVKLASDVGVLTLGAGNKGSKMDALLAQIYTVRDELFQQAEEARAKVAKGSPVVAAPQSTPADELDDLLED
jgi:hypothetical protein